MFHEPALVSAAALLVSSAYMMMHTVIFSNLLCCCCCCHSCLPACLFASLTFLQHVSGDDMFCKHDDVMLQLFTSCLFLSGAAAALVGIYTCQRFGRKATMIAGGACFLGGTILVTLAIHMSMLVLGRLILGVGVGFAAQVSEPDQDLQVYTFVTAGPKLSYIRMNMQNSVA
jgi:MFS family permease